MEKLFQISKEYSLLDLHKEKLRQTELIRSFILEVNAIKKENSFSAKEAITLIIKAYLAPSQGRLHLFLILQYIWEHAEIESNLDEDLLISLFEDLLIADKIDVWTEYYLECFLDIWNFNIDLPVPIPILKSIIIKQHAQTYSYGALIKALAYLDKHCEKEIESVIAAARDTDQYKIDPYYRSWIDE